MAENEQKQEQGDDKKSSKKWLIIAAIVLLLVGGGGAGYYFFFAGEPGEDAAEESEDSEEGSEQAVDKQSFYYDVTKPLIVNYPKGSAARLVQVSISIMVKDEPTVEALKKHEPMIRNNLLMLISAHDPGELKSVEGKEILRGKMFKEISEVIQKMTESDQVQELFFTSFVMQ